MADEPNVTSETTVTEPLGNSEATRNPDGSIKDTQTPPNPSPTEKKTEDKPSTEAKTEDKKAEDKPSGAPDKYAAFTFPEGQAPDEKVVAEASEIFKKNNLSQESAQEFIGLWNKQAEGLSSRLETLITDTRNGWRKEIAQDKVLGNGTDNLRDEVRATIGRALEGLGNPKTVGDFKEAMDLTGAGDHPAFIRAFYELAKQVTEGKLVKGNGPSAGGQQVPGTGPRSAASALFPNLPSANG